ncbi:MAG: helical backbone metal receptor [Gammaproteobacteria bacterium]
MESVTNPLVDAIGVEHTPADANARIVSLVPSLTELLFDLGLCDNVVGRTTFCIRPAPKVDAVARVGGTKTVAFDRLAAARPTHVLVNIDENLRDDVPKLEALGAKVVVTHPKTAADNLPLYALIGELFNAKEAADSLSVQLQSALADAHRAARELPSRNVLYLIWRDPWMTISQNTYIGAMLKSVNWHHVRARSDARYPEIHFNDAAWREADLILLSSEPFPFKDKHVSELLEHVPCAAGKVRFIDGEMTSWYGSRAIEGLTYLTKFAQDINH